MRKLFLALPLILVLIAVSAIAAPPGSQEVIGKVTVEAGAGIVLYDGSQMFRGIAAEKQVFYIIDKVIEGGRTIWVADAENFIHNCPAHGAEVINFPLMALIPQDLIDNGTIKATLEIFKKD